MSPESLLTAKERFAILATVKFVSRVPDSLLPARTSCCSPVCVCIEVGIVPVKKLFDASNTVRFEDGEISPRFPCSPLSDTCRVRSCGSDHTQEGMLPPKNCRGNSALKPGMLRTQRCPLVSWSNTRVCSCVAEHISAGREPWKQLL